MKLEDQVVSLELSKKLKELGIVQKSLFYWQLADENCYGLEFEAKFVPFTCPGLEKYSAFTASELLEILPEIIIHSSKDNYLCCFCSDKHDKAELFFYKNLANSCAKMLINLIENNIWKPKI